MKKLVFGSLCALAASQLVACVASDDFATVNAEWQFLNFPDTATDCPAGYPTIAHYNQEVDPISLAAIGSPIIDLYDCDTYANFTDTLPPAVYQSWIESTTDGGGGVYAQSTSAIVDVRTQDQTLSVEIFNDAGYFQFGWELVDAATAAPISCAEAGADGVEIISTVTGGTAAVTDQFDCEQGAAITAALLEGSYTVSIDAFQDGAGALGEPFTQPNRIIQAPNRITDLGDIQLPID